MWHIVGEVFAFYVSLLLEVMGPMYVFCIINTVLLEVYQVKL